MSFYGTSKRALACAIVSSLLIPMASVAAYADPSLAEIAAEMRALRAENRQMKEEIRGLRGETRTTRHELKQVARHAPIAGAPGGDLGLTPIVPPNATPIYATADKKIQIGALTLTPGGFVAMETAYRSRTEQADIGTQYQGIPFGPQAGTSELRFSARQSRASLLVESPIAPGMSVAGYGEFDFLGSGATSNSNESNSYVPRIRHLYMTVDSSATGWHFLAGQTWSLLTMNNKGIVPRTEDTPPTIDAQYVPGFVWKRQPQIRITKDFDQHLWFAVAAETPQNTFTNCTAGVNGLAIPGNNVTCDLGGNNNLNGTAVTNFSLNHVPDVTAKVAYDTALGDRRVHLEGKAIYRDIYARVDNTVLNTASNRDITGYGFGGGLVAEILPKRLDFEASTLVGRGIGSYGTAQFNDAVISATGTPSPLREEMVLAGLTFHATPLLDFYAFGGFEQVHQNYITTAPGVFSGYGVPNANNTGCFNDVAVGTCGGNAKRVWQVTGGVWDKVYKGAYGEVRAGLQYSYTQRELFAGNGGVNPLPFSPATNDHTVMTSIRYYPFQ